MHYEPAADYGYLAVHVNTGKKHIAQCKSLILKEFDKLKNVTEKEINEAKEYLEGEFLLQNEDNYQYADELCFWELIKDAKFAGDYIGRIKKVTKKDITSASNKYFRNNYAIALIEQK